MLCRFQRIILYSISSFLVFYWYVYITIFLLTCYQHNTLLCQGGIQASKELCSPTLFPLRHRQSLFCNFSFHAGFINFYILFWLFSIYIIQYTKRRKKVTITKAFIVTCCTYCIKSVTLFFNVYLGRRVTIL